MSTDDWFSVYDSEEEEEEELSEEDQEFISRIDKLHYSGDKGIRDAWDLLKDKDSNSIEFLWECCHSDLNFNSRSNLKIQNSILKPDFVMPTT